MKFAECMREQGVDVPDPKAAAGGPAKLAGDVSREEFEDAAEACEEYRRDIAPQLSEEEQQEFRDKALAFARCMREHGLDVPDPTFSAEGGAQMRLGRDKGDPEDPEFQAAERDCGRVFACVWIVGRLIAYGFGHDLLRQLVYVTGST